MSHDEEGRRIAAYMYSVGRQATVKETRDSGGMPCLDSDASTGACPSPDLRAGGYSDHAER
jgi:hypothetical protein